MSSGKIKRPFVRAVHLQALLFLLLYSLLSKSIFIKSVVSESALTAFLIPYLFGIVAGGVFLFLFSHEDFFHFAKDIKKIESTKEGGLLKKYLHYGKVLCTLIIGTIGGPVFSSLTIRLILNNYKYKFLLLAIGNIPSTLMHVSLARGVFTVLF